MRLLGLYKITTHDPSVNPSHYNPMQTVYFAHGEGSVADATKAYEEQMLGDHTSAYATAVEYLGGVLVP